MSTSGGETVLCGDHSPVECVRVDAAGDPVESRAVVLHEPWWLEGFLTFGSSDTSDGGVLLAGSTLVHGLDESGALLRIDGRLRPAWSRIGEIWFGFTDRLWLNHAIERRSGATLAIGGMWMPATGSWHGGWLVELAADGSRRFEAMLGDPWLGGIGLGRPVETADDGVLIPGVLGDVSPPAPWLIRFDPALAVSWQYTYRATGPFTLNLASPGAGGRVAVVGSWGTAGELVLVVVDAQGAPVLSRTLAADGRLRPIAVARAPGGDLLVAGVIESGAGVDAFLLRLADDGQLVSARAYPVGKPVSVHAMAVAADGSIRVAGVLGENLWLMALEPDDRSGLPCQPARDLSVMLVDVPITRDVATVPLWDPQIWGSWSSHRGVEAEHAAFDVCALPLPPRHIAGVRAVRQGDGVALSWLGDDRSGSYHVWSVPLASEISQARLGGGGTGIPDCSPPFPATAPECVDAGAVRRGPSLLFYQVRGVSGGLEGP